MVTASTQEEIESNLTAHYEIEEFVYFPSLHVNVKSATSTRGSNLTGQNRDRTGIMIWPATHLLCQEIVSGNVGSTAKTILELGCGCGLVGVVASLALNSQYEKKIWVSSDMDEKALELCIHNFELNGIDATTDDGPRVRKLTWGESKEMHAIQDELFNQTHTSKFDVVVGADIVYPATTGQVLVALFDTVNFFLKDGGVFYLSFATRDGYQTPQKLIEAASIAGFAISSFSPLSSEIRGMLPPLLDSTVLILKRCEYARELNNKLGGLDCTTFPKIQEKMQRAEEESSVEEWEAPGGFEYSDDEES
jgi:Lysine methyltransferase